MGGYRVHCLQLLVKLIDVIAQWLCITVQVPNENTTNTPTEMNGIRCFILWAIRWTSMEWPYSNTNMSGIASLCHASPGPQPASMGFRVFLLCLSGVTWILSGKMGKLLEVSEAKNGIDPISTGLRWKIEANLKPNVISRKPHHEPYAHYLMWFELSAPIRMSEQRPRALFIFLLTVWQTLSSQNVICDLTAAIVEKTLRKFRETEILLRMASNLRGEFEIFFFQADGCLATGMCPAVKRM